MSPSEIRAAIAASIETHCGALPSCDEDIFQCDKFMIGAASVLEDVCSMLNLYDSSDDSE